MTSLFGDFFPAENREGIPEMDLGSMFGYGKTFVKLR